LKKKLPYKAAECVDCNSKAEERGEEYPVVYILAMNPSRCRYHNALEKTKKKKGGITKKKKTTGELKLFRELLSHRPFCSFITGKPINEIPKPWNFLHVLPKGQNKYPKFKLNPKNIVLGTLEEHEAWDHNRASIKDNPLWKKMFELEQELLTEYKILNSIILLFICSYHW